MGPETTFYEHTKNSFLETAKHCASEGISFIPMVVEAHSGAWGPMANKVWLKIGKAISVLSGESTALEALRAILRRAPAAAELEDRNAACDLLCSVNTHLSENL